MKNTPHKPKTGDLLKQATIADLVVMWQEREGAMSPYYPVIWERVKTGETVVEFGLRRGGSTAAFLHAGAIVVSYDLDLPDPRIELYRHLSKLAAGRWAMVYADTRVIPIPPCDWLLVDSEHTYDQVKAELRPDVVACVRKGIMFHDTIVHGVDGRKSQGGGGIWPAIEEFLAEPGCPFHLDYHATEGVGFTVLMR